MPINNKREKMRRKAQDDSVVTIRRLLIVLVIILLAAFFLYRVDIISWFKQLPAYNYNQKDVEVTPGADEAGTGACTHGIAGKIDKGDVYLLENGGYVKTEIYYKGDADSGVFYLPKSWLGIDYLAGDQEIGKFENNKIIINPDVLDLNSVFWQKIRYVSDLQFKDEIEQISNSLVGAGNIICKKGDNVAINFIPDWHENASVETINVKLDELNPGISNGKVTINPSKYFYSSKNQKKQLAFMENRLKYFELRKLSEKIGSSEVESIEIVMIVEPGDKEASFGRVYPDNAVWFDPNAESYKSLSSSASLLVKIDSDVKLNSRIYKRAFPQTGYIDDYGGPLYLDAVTSHPHYYETNLRIDYNELKSYIDKKQ